MVAVAVGILSYNGKILVCQRKRSMRYPLKWEFPGGKVESGESARDCLLRELEEELAITAEIGTEFHRQRWVYPDSGTFDVTYFHVVSYTGAIENKVFEAVQWISPGDLDHLDMLDGNREAIEKLKHEPPAS